MQLRKEAKPTAKQYGIMDRMKREKHTAETPLPFGEALVLEIILKNAVPVSEDERITVTWRKVIVCTLVALVGFNLRSVILGVPPILPLI